DEKDVIQSNLSHVPEADEEEPVLVSSFEDQKDIVMPKDSNVVETQNGTFDVSFMPVGKLENQVAANVYFESEVEQMVNAMIDPFQRNYNNQMHFSSCDPKPDPKGFYVRVSAPAVPDLHGKYVTSHVSLFYSVTYQCSTLISSN